MITTLYFVGVSIFTLALFYVLFRRGGGLDAQLVANRRIPRQYVGIWMAIAFTWGATFFYAGQLAYTAGWLGLSFYLLGNGGGLALAFFLAPKIPVPEKKYSIVEAMGERFSSKTGWIYSIGVMGIQGGYALTLQFLAAAALLSFTMQADKTYTVLAAAAAMIIPVIIGGIRSSAVLDLIKGSMMTVLIVILAPLAIWKAGGFGAVIGGLAGYVAPGLASSGSTSAWLFAITIGIPLVVSLISAGVIDQSMFQRYFSVNQTGARKLGLPLVAGLAFFTLNILAAASLGFLAANSSLGIHVDSVRIAGFAAMNTLVPTAAIFFTITVIAAFVASGDTALNASSSVWAMDVYKKWWRPDATEKQVILAQRLSMVVFILIAAAIALTGVDMLTLTIAVGVFRSALFIPTIVAFVVDKRIIPDVFGGILVAMAVSLVLYGTGKYCGSAADTCQSLPLFSAKWYEFSGALSGWIITAVYCLWLWFRNRRVGAYPAQYS